MKRLDEIEARANAATEGPWTAEYSGEQGNCVLPPGYRSTREAVAVTRLLRARADAEFIAQARTDVPALVAALRAVVAIHRPVTVPGEVFGTWGEAKQCEDCEQRWPCNTLDSIRQHLGEDA